MDTLAVCAAKTSERVLIALLLAAAASAQIKAPPNKKFEVVSVKPDTPGSNPMSCTFPPSTFSSPVQFTIEHCALSTLIKSAYDQSTRERMIGVPKWADSVWYSVSAKSPSPVSMVEKYGMLRAVMEERFKLKWHTEKRQLPVYYLSVSGPIKLRKTVPGSCRTWDPIAGPPSPEPNKPPACALWMNRVLPDGGRRLEVGGVTLAQLASVIGSILGRQGMDSTGSKDLFDISLEYANPELEGGGNSTAEASAAPGAPAKLTPPAASSPSALPSIFTALKKVGLELKAGRGPVEVFVVDSVEKPSAN